MEGRIVRSGGAVTQEKEEDTQGTGSQCSTVEHHLGDKWLLTLEYSHIEGGTSCQSLGSPTSLGA